MKKYISILFLGICYSSISLSQTYELAINPNLSSYIHLDEKEKKFVITMVFQASKDIILTDLISFGSFTSQHDNLLLLDKTSGAKIKIQKTQSLLINPKEVRGLNVKKGFTWMNNKFFNQINSSASQTELSYAHSYMNRVKNTTLIKNQKNMRARKNDLFTGTYCSENVPNFILNLEENGTYAIKFRGINLSLGKWNRRSNLLILKDKDVGAMFFIEIQGDKLNPINIMPLGIINEKLVKYCSICV